MGYGIYSIYRKPIARMPTIPEHEEVYAVNDVWDNEFRMLERMSSLEESDMIDLGLYDLVWDKDFGKLVPCGPEDDLEYNNSPNNVVIDSEMEDASKSLRAILESFERSAAIHSDDDDEEEYDEEYEEDMMRGNSGYSGYARISCEVVSATEEEHKIVAVVTGESSSSEVCSSFCRPITVNNGGESTSSTENIPVADVMRRARSLSNGPNTAIHHQKQKVY